MAVRLLARCATFDIQGDDRPGDVDLSGSTCPDQAIPPIPLSGLAADGVLHVAIVAAPCRPQPWRGVAPLAAGDSPRQHLAAADRGSSLSSRIEDLRDPICVGA